LEEKRKKWVETYGLEEKRRKWVETYGDQSQDMTPAAMTLEGAVGPTLLGRLQVGRRFNAAVVLMQHSGKAELAQSTTCSTCSGPASHLDDLDLGPLEQQLRSTQLSQEQLEQHAQHLSKQRRLSRWPLRLTPLRLLGGSHCLFIGLLIIMLHERWWEGDVLTQCGLDGRPFVPGYCVCGGTLPTICWISEALNGTWGLSEGLEPVVVWRSRIWLTMAVLPAASGVWLIF
ncbi:unnamed protein product, partial [Polarella glacialis]